MNLVDGVRSLVPSGCPKIKHKVSDTFVLVCRGGSLSFQVPGTKKKEQKKPILQRLLPRELESLGEFPAFPRRVSAQTDPQPCASAASSSLSNVVQGDDALSPSSGAPSPSLSAFTNVCV